MLGLEVHRMPLIVGLPLTLAIREYPYHFGVVVGFLEFKVSILDD